MRLLHISDLHLGKRIFNRELIDEQRYILQQIIDCIREQKIDALLMAGDIYDKSQPSGAAITLLDDFLKKLDELNIRTYIISGNHDSNVQISYCSSFLKKSNIFVSERFEGKLQKYTAEDEYGDVNFYLLPFFKPVHINVLYPDSEINDYNSAVNAILDHSDIDYTKRNILLCHQFISGATTCESEELNVGGLADMESDALKGFTYVALGHIHTPQKITDSIRYSGSIYKYSFDEVNQQKGGYIIDLDDSGFSASRFIFSQLRDLRRVEGSFRDIIDMPYSDDYIEVILTDEAVPLDARGSLLTVFPNMLSLKLKRSDTVSEQNELTDFEMTDKTPYEYFADFYREQNCGEGLSQEEEALLKQLLMEENI